jgi:excisionase family DNA binding protein
MTQLNLCIGVKEAAAALGISHWSLRKYVRQGRLVAVRIGRRVLIQPAELERLIEQGRSGGKL